MSLFAIGDLHLHYGSLCKAKTQLSDPLWIGHEEKLMDNCRRLIGQDDVLVLLGDHSWGKNLGECEKDFEYIMSLPEAITTCSGTVRKPQNSTRPIRDV